MIAGKATALLLLLAITKLSGQDPHPSWVDSLKRMDVVQLRDGANQIDLVGDGGADMVWVAWRDNGNAHGAYYITFNISDTTRQYGSRWLLVPIMTPTKSADFSKQELDIYRTAQGADCMLDDLRLLRSKESHAPTVVVTAERDLGETFADAMPVTFKVYRLAVRGPSDDGPPYYYHQVHVLRTNLRYCDVEEAFSKTLGLGGEQP